MTNDDSAQQLRTVAIHELHLAKGATILVESADVVYEAFPVVEEAMGMWETGSVFQVAVGIA